MQLARSLAFNVLFYLMTTALMVLGAPTVLFGRRGVLGLAKLWARWTLALLAATCGLRARVVGLENVPQGGFVLAAKHQSFLEILVMVANAGDFAFAYKRELGWIPLFGWYLKAGGQLSIDRARGAGALAELSRKTDDLLSEGRQLLIFPEGTRRAPGAPPRYKYGVVHLYDSLHATVVPVAVNAGLYWPRRKLIRRSGTCTVQYLPAIGPGLSARDFAAELQARIETASDRLAAEAIAEAPALADAMASDAETRGKRP